MFFAGALAILASAPPLVAQGAAPAPAPSFVVNDTSVMQGRFQAIARSRDTIVSSYPRAAREVRFSFSINGAENEFPPGTEHTIYLRPVGGKLVTPLYAFGVETAPPRRRPSSQPAARTVRGG